MKKIIMILALVMMGVTLAKGQKAYALWCAGNGTLYFAYTSTNIVTGGKYSFTGNTAVTKFWSDREVLLNGNTSWLTTVRINLKKVVFDKSFKDVKPSNTYKWFEDCNKLSSIEGMPNLDTGKVTDMGYMFNNCKNLKSLDVSNFNTEKVTDMRYMFNGCSGLTSLDVSNFNTEEVKSMSMMFGGCSGLTSLDVSKFYTEKLNNANGMFEGCSGLTSLDLSFFKTTNLQGVGRMFYGCSSLTTIYCDDTWDVSESQSMFEGCTSLVGGCGKTYRESDTDGKFANPGENGYFTEVPKTAYALWCESNSTLYFVYTPEEVKTDASYSFTEDNAVSALWSGTDVTDAGEPYPQWLATVAVDLKRAVFDESVKKMKPEKTKAWFYNCKNLTSIDGLHNLDTSEVTNMNGMFYNCSGLTSLNTGNFSTEKVEDMSGLFYGCSGLTSLYLSKFNTENVKDMSGMFGGCSGLTSLNVSNFNTENVNDMSGMFEGCSGLTTLDVSNFKTSNLQKADKMFMGCTNLTTIYCDDTWDVSESQSMFEGCTSLVGGCGKTYSESDTDGKFANPGENGYFTEVPKTAHVIWCESNSTLYFVYTAKEVTAGNKYDFTEDNEVTALWSGADVTDASYGFRKWTSTVDDYVKRVVFDESFKGVQPTSTEWWFKHCTELTSIEGLQYLDTSEVTNMEAMFDNCKNLSSLDLSHFNTSKVENMSSLFYGCYSLKELDLSTFNTEKVEYMDAMFASCKALEELDVSKFNTGQVILMVAMFTSCNSLKELDLSTFNTENVEDMEWMFSHCYNLTSLDVSNFNTEKVKNMELMFDYCEALTSLDLSSFNMKNVENTYEMFYNCSGLKTIYCNDTWEVGKSQKMFVGCTSLVGEYGKTYSESDIDGMFANPGENGYFTLTRETLQGFEYGGAYWTTYYNSLSARVADENTTVYVLRLSADNSELQPTEVPDKIINAGEAVILKSTAAEITLTRTSEEGTYDFSGNSLQGMDRTTAVPTDQGTIYTLSVEDDGLAFVKFTGEELQARRAYMGINDASGAPIPVSIEEVTGIENVEFIIDNSQFIIDGGWFTLDGRKIEGRPTMPGVYINNGRKVIIKN